MLVQCRDWLPKLARWSRPFPLDCQPAHVNTANSGVALAKARCRTPHTVADAAKLPSLGSNIGTRWRIYPMYAYAHPIEHALKNISSICTSSAGNHYPTGTPIVQVQRDVG